VHAPGESEYETPTIRVGYASMLTPDSAYDYHLTTGELSLLKRTPVLDDPRFGPYQSDNYVQERGWATAPDGTQVPLSIVRKADVPLDGSAPALLYGYGRMRHPWIQASPFHASRCWTRHRLCHCPCPWRR
jgi:oligopeptidase B